MQITNEPFEIGALSSSCWHPAVITEAQELIHTVGWAEYVTGEVAGVVAEDVLSIGSPAVTIPEQAFGDAGAVSLDFLSASCDGLFGLAFPTVSSLGDQSNPYDSPFFSMVRSPAPAAASPLCPCLSLSIRCAQVAEGLLDSNM